MGKLQDVHTVVRSAKPSDNQKVAQTTNMAYHDAGGVTGLGYDAAGNLKGVRQEAEGQVTTTTYQYTYLNGSWQQSAALTRRGGDVVGTITQRDANGFVVGIRQPKATGSAAQAPDGSLAAALTNQVTQPTSNDARYDRTFVNDASGTTVFVSQGGFNAQGEVNSSIANPASGYQGGVTGSALTPGHVQRQLVVNGEVLARYGDAPTQEENTPQTNTPAYVDTADFRLQAAQIRPRHKSMDPIAYTVVGGETLKDIARNVLGDASLWWRIAEANSLAVSGDGALTAGQTLTVPKLSLNANSVETFQPYDPSQAMGSMDPVLPVPANGGGCGGIGAIIMVVVAIVVTIYTAGALAAAGSLGSNALGAATLAGTTTGGGFAATMAAGASVLGGGAGIGAGIAAGVAGGAMGSIVSQAVGNAIGAQDGFSWKGVALSALSGGVSGGLAGTSLLGGTTLGVTVARAAASSVLAQGIGVTTGLQSSFNWKSVAASAAGAGVGWGMNNALGLTDANGLRIDQSFGLESIGKATLSGFAAGLTTAVARGGRISVQQVATDAFGNALGQSLAYSSGQASDAKSDMQEDRLGDFIQQNQDAWNRRIITADVHDALLDAFDNPRSYVSGLGTQVADFVSNDGQRIAERGYPIVGERTLTDAPSIPIGLLPQGVDPDSVFSFKDENNAVFYGMRMPDGKDAYKHQSLFFPDGGQTQDGPYRMEIVGTSSSLENLTADQLFNETTNRNIAAGTHDTFREIGNAVADGRYGDAWRYMTFDASSQARAAAVARVFPKPSPDIARIDKMIASPIGTIFSGTGRLFGASQRVQDMLLATGSFVEQMSGSFGGVYKQTLTAKPLSPFYVSATVRPKDSSSVPPGTLRFEPAGYHGTVDNAIKSRGPTNGQDALDVSRRVKETSPRRIGIDYEAGDFVVFDRTINNVYHGHVRSWADLHPDMQRVLRKEGMVDSRGNILRDK